MSSVLVLNSSSEPLHVCDWRRAVSLICKGRAQVVEHSDRRLLADDFPLPVVIRLHSQVFVPYAPLSASRGNILARDKHTCQYCATKRGEMTLDHVVPRSRGGGSTWENLVTACQKCNARKGDRSLSESGMKLLSTPARPRDRMSFLIMKHRSQNPAFESWSRYLKVS